MQTQLTVASIRAIYESLASSPAAFVGQLNEITQRLMNTDLWEGSSDEVLFPTSDQEYIVLPPQFVSILGYTREKIPLPVFGRYHQYIEMGIGWQDLSKMTMSGLIEDGMVVTQVIPTGTFTLRVKITAAADAGKVIRFYGNDQNGEDIYTPANGVKGIDLTTANPSADTTQQFTTVDGIQAPANMIGRWTLWTVISGTETQIGEYEPGDTAPNFRKYKVGIRRDPDVLRCFCRRGWVKVTAETDWVWPRCLPAIKLGFKALQLENANKNEGPTGADAQWARAYEALDDELAVYRGYQVPSLRMFGGPYPRFNQIVN